MNLAPPIPRLERPRPPSASADGRDDRRDRQPDAGQEPRRVPSAASATSPTT